MKKLALTEKQREMIAYGERHDYCILAADMRLGKSRAAIEIRNKRKANCLIICPAYLVSNWKKEINKWSPHSCVTTFKKGKEIYEVFDSDYVVISYELVKKAEHLFEWADMVVCDEVHHLKNMKAKKTEFIHKAIYENSTKCFIGLTGTPIKNRVREFYSLLALTYYDPKLDSGYQPDFEGGFDKNIIKNLIGITDLKFQRSFLDRFPDEITFAEHFSFPETYDIKVSKGKKTFMVPITKYSGLKNKHELKQYLKGRYLRVRADKNDLPPLSYVDTLVSDIDNTALLKAFKNYFNDAKRIEVARANKRPEYEIRMMRTSSVLPEHKRNAALQKVPFTIKYVENLMESVECCLVYSDHKDSCQQIADHFGIQAITGEVPAHKRAAMVADFQAGKTNMICATVGSLKEGADLFRAKDLVINDPPWVSGDLLQVVNRTRALGEKAPRTIHRILGSPQDAAIYEALDEKQKVIDEAT